LKSISQIGNKASQVSEQSLDQSQALAGPQRKPA
jgi:hypothetical protein